MVSDSPYEVGDLALAPWQGALAGLVGAGLSLVILPQAPAPAPHFVLGGLMGLMYALCQQRIPLRGLMAVGIFYGIFLWVVGGVLFGGVFASAATKAALRSKLGLAGFEVYSLTLALVAILAGAARPQAQRAVPKD